MAFIPYRSPGTLAPDERVSDPDNIIQIHSVHPTVMRRTWELYGELMHGDGPISRREPAGLTRREAALVSYADILTRTPAAVSVREIAQLRKAGFDDRAIHDACTIVAYVAVVNRLAKGLGVELDTPLSRSGGETEALLSRSEDDQ